MVFGVECFIWTLYQGICGLLKEEKVEGSKAISNFGSGNLQGAVFSIVEQKGYLARWKVVDAFMAQKIVIKTLTHSV
jgi:hypothetical protein